MREIPEDLACSQRLSDLVDAGLSPFTATKSTFAEPRYLRGVLRGPGISVDQEKAAIYAQLERHPDLVMVRDYIANSDAFHRELSGAWGAVHYSSS